MKDVPSGSALRESSLIDYLSL